MDGATPCGVVLWRGLRSLKGRVGSGFTVFALVLKQCLLDFGTLVSGGQVSGPLDPSFGLGVSRTDCMA